MKDMCMEKKGISSRDIFRSVLNIGPGILDCAVDNKKPLEFCDGKADH